MVNSFEYIDTISGPAGELAETATGFGKLNDTLTRCMDAWEGPDATDAFDASCNTCAHFVRRPFDRKDRLVSIHGFPGTCAKDGSEQVGWPRGQFCDMPCYVNRRTGKGPGKREVEHATV